MPSVEAVWSPRGPSVAVFIDDGLSSEQCQWISVPVIWALEGFVRGDGRIDA